MLLGDDSHIVHIGSVCHDFDRLTLDHRKEAVVGTSDCPEFQEIDLDNGLLGNPFTLYGMHSKALSILAVERRVHIATWSTLKRRLRQYFSVWLHEAMKGDFPCFLSIARGFPPCQGLSPLTRFFHCGRERLQQRGDSGTVQC